MQDITIAKVLKDITKQENIPLTVIKNTRKELKQNNIKDDENSIENYLQDNFENIILEIDKYNKTDKIFL